MPEITNLKYFKTRADWRRWLKNNHAVVDELWLIQYKKYTGIECISYDEIVEEALCYGWIDGIIKRIDEEKYTRRLTPRRAKSVWSELNKTRAERMIKAKLMTEAGLAKIIEAKNNGEWDKDRSQPEAIEIPEYFQKVLKQNKTAHQNFMDLSPSHQKQYLGWILQAKKEETRQRRIEKALVMITKIKKPGMM